MPESLRAKAGETLAKAEHMLKGGQTPPTGEDPSLHTICERPEDDKPRLDYADRLDQGDEPREAAAAEFIRVQCALASMTDDDPSRPNLTARELALQEGQQKHWRALLDPYLVRDFTLRRGFPDQVTLSADAFIRYGGDLLQAAPIRAVKIVECQDVGALAASPHLTNLISLDLSRSGIQDLSKSGIGDAGDERWPPPHTWLSSGA